ncbi:unnamed protein product [Gulo gulo]|uniref:Hexosyltransferase n=1 Tax=Gulo gulo TaxID=48420 RepID=A0A9X9PUN8_GULGU|nr:unnamed protein product [Gulo gulo]
MVGHRAPVAPWEGWRVVVLEVPSALQWQDVSMQYMVMVSHFCEQHFLREVDDLVCADVDMKFCDHVGIEILSLLFGTLHPSFYWCPVKTSATSAGHCSRTTSPWTRVTFTIWGPFWGAVGAGGSLTDLGLSPGDGSGPGQWDRGCVA